MIESYHFGNHPFNEFRPRQSMNAKKKKKKLIGE